MELSQTSLEEHLDAWGEWGPQDRYYAPLHPFASYLLRQFRDEYWHQELECEGRYYTLFCTTVVRFDPRPSKVDPKMLSIWPNRAAYDAGDAKRLRGRVGRMIRRVCPFVTDAILERWVNHYVKTYGVSSDDYTIKTSKIGSDFAHAYSHTQATMANLDTHRFRKSLATSCLRYDFSHLEMHPAAAYGSGDFTIAWAEDQDARIAGRCVVYTPEDGGSSYHGPVYACNEVVCDMLQNTVETQLKATKADYHNWVGARLLRVEEGGGFIGPYLDIEPQALTDSGSYLVIKLGGEIDGSQYEGVLGAEPCCADCGYPCDDEYFNEDAVPICENCYSNDYVYCEYWPGTRRRSGNEAEVTLRRWGRTVTQYWCGEAVEEYAVHCIDVDAYWSIDDALELADGDFISPEGLEEGDYGEAEDTGEIHLSNELVVLDGITVHRDNIDTDVHSFNNNTNEWETRDAA